MPNPVKPFVLTILIKPLIAMIATIKLTNQPIAKIFVFSAFKNGMTSFIFKTVAAKSVGTPKKKLNSVACSFVRPKKRPPTIVAPLLDVPGIIAQD